MVFMGFPMFLIVVFVALVVILLIVTAQQHRRHSSATELRLCASCGASHPPFAEFCRRCGKKL